MSATWVDVSDVVEWKGPPTGIPRVATNLVRVYAEESGARFFVFSDSTLAFREVASDTVRRLTNPVRHHPSDPASDWKSNRRRAATRIWREIRRHLPLGLKRRAKAPVVSSWAWLSGAVARAVRSGADIGLRLVPGAPEESRAAFAAGDRIIVLGSGWRHQHLQRALLEQRRATGVVVYQVIYDLAPILLPHSYGPGFPDAFARYLFDLMSASDGLLAISANTRVDAQEFCAKLRIPPPPIETFRLGDEHISSSPATPIPKFSGADFVLSVGTFELRKNYLLLYQVWKLALEQGVKLPQLVIVGRVGWAAGDTLSSIQRDPQVRDSITIMDGVTDAQLEWLYDNCLFTVYPSLYEGWGLPIAESLARGKLCAASSSSAMPEVAGDLIGYFSPYSAADCLRVLTRYLDPLVRSELEARIEDSYRATTWRSSLVSLNDAINNLERGPVASKP